MSEERQSGNQSGSEPATPESEQPAPADADVTPEDPASPGARDGGTERAPTTASSGGSGRGAVVIAIVALVLSAAAAIGAGYAWMRFDTQSLVLLSRLDSTEGAYERQLNAIDSELTKLSSGMEALENDQRALADQQEKLTGRQQDLQGSVERVYEELDRSLNRWTLEEVEQLLLLANHRLELAREIDVALSALELADARLERIGDPALTGVRERLTGEINALRSLEKVDVPGLALTLKSVSSGISGLPLANQVEAPRPPADNGGDTGGTDNQWIQAGREMLDDITGLVRIQNIDEPQKPLLAPEERYFLTQNIRLMLEGAQLALLRRDAEVFSSNLAQASQWLREYYAADSDAVRNAVAEIERVASAPIDQPLPDISGSLNALRDVMQRRAG